MGVSFQPARCVKRAEESRNESHTINPNGSPHRATKAKEKPAGVTGGASLIVRTHPHIRIDLPLFRERRVARRPAGPAFQYPDYAMVRNIADESKLDSRAPKGKEVAACD
jgi:hypothetical protein